jgi:hypothetical protein
MKHTIETLTGFAPIKITIELNTEAEALLFWGKLGASDHAALEVLRKCAGDGAKYKVERLLDTGIADGTYSLWNALDDLLKERGIIPQ